METPFLLVRRSWSEERSWPEENNAPLVAGAWKRQRKKEGVVAGVCSPSPEKKEKNKRGEAERYYE